jgi:chemotaxis protein MotB
MPGPSGLGERYRPRHGQEEAMVFRVIPRAFLVLALGALMQMAGCRSSTDRMRVLEAEKADAERRNQEAKQKEAEMRAQMIKAEGDAESNRAKADALAAQLELAKGREGAGGSQIDVAGLKGALAGSGVVVNEREGGGATLVLASDITFNPGQADPNKKAQETLGKVVRTLKETKGVGKIRVEGHTDSDPIKKSGFKSNDELSLARATTVKDYLIGHGIDDSLIEVDGHGDKQPTASNETPEGKARNRRVEIILYGQ